MIDPNYFIIEHGPDNETAEIYFQDLESVLMTEEDEEGLVETTFCMINGQHYINRTMEPLILPLRWMLEGKGFIIKSVAVAKGGKC